jgi:alkylhydroperoxidase family enzyme
MLETLLTTVLEKPGTMDARAREAAAACDPSSPYIGYVTKVRDASHKVTQADIGQLRGAGLSEEQIFELTVSAALGAGRERLQAAKRALGGGR